MAEQTGQHGYLFRFDKVNATALHMLFVSAASRNEKYQVNVSLFGLRKIPDFQAICNQHIPMNPKVRENSLAGF